MVRKPAYTLAVLRLPLSVDNFECIAVRPVPGGRYIYLLSDNNQNPQQRTLLLAILRPGDRRRQRRALVPAASVLPLSLPASDISPECDRSHAGVGQDL